MKKWTALQPENEDARWQALSSVLTARGCANEYIKWDASRGLEDLTSIEEFDHVRLSKRLAPQVLKHVRVQSSWTTLLGAVDGMNKVIGGWWPLCALYESVGQILIDGGQDLDPRGTVLVAGAGETARIAVAAFFKAGFQKFLLTNHDEEQALALINELKRKFFGLTVEWVPKEKIVSLPGISSVFANCMGRGNDEALVGELSYLNFLKRTGFVLDFYRGPSASLLLQEARDARVKITTGDEIASRTDVLWAKWAFKVDLNLEEYREVFKSHSVSIT